MKCPKCHDVEMYAFAYREVEVDRCPSCDGVWLDKDELETILNNELGAQIDLVSFTQNPPSSDEAPAYCHTCDREMTALVGAADVRFEWCETCEGMFFDKGELTIIQAFEGD